MNEPPCGIRLAHSLGFDISPLLGAVVSGGVRGTDCVKSHQKGIIMVNKEEGVEKWNS